MFLTFIVCIVLGYHGRNTLSEEPRIIADALAEHFQTNQRHLSSVSCSYIPSITSVLSKGNSITSHYLTHPCFHRILLLYTDRLVPRRSCIRKALSG